MGIPVPIELALHSESHEIASPPLLRRYEAGYRREEATPAVSGVAIEEHRRALVQIVWNVYHHIAGREEIDAVADLLDEPI